MTQVTPPILEGMPEAPDPNANYKEQLVDQYLRQLEAYNAYLRPKAMDDLFVFNKYVMEVEEGKQILAPVQKEMCHFVTDNTHMKKLLLIPRGHLKSTLITIGYCIQQILKNPNIRILILNATWQMAVDFLTEIKKALQQNETILELYGDVTQGAIEWSQDRITLKRTDSNIKGPTVWATGVNSNLVGSHPDMIIFDDVVNRENTTTREQIEKVKLAYKDALDLLEPGGQFVIIGTRWSENDLYGWILDKDNNIRESFNTFIKRAYSGNITTGEGFDALWKEKFTLEELRTRLREKGWYEFSAQYLNNPIPDEAATFKRVNFHYYDMEDIRAKEMYKVLCVDPAISEKKGADYTAMVGNGIDIFSNIFNLSITRAHMNPKELVDAIFDLQELWHFNVIGIETIAYQKALAFYVNEEIKRRKRPLPIQEIKAHDTSKDQRIKGLQPLYEQNKVFHRKEMRETIYLEDELLAFPRGKYDDVVDAHSMTLDFLRPPRQKQTRLKHDYLY